MGDVTPLSRPEPAFTAPAPLTESHDLSQFDCGTPILNDWLRKRALKSHTSGGSRVFVVCQENSVIAYYCLAMGAVFHEQATSKVKRNMPDPVPVVVLGRLAVDGRWSGKGLGSALLRDAVLKACKAAELAGTRAILVHAKDDPAKNFYEMHGFKPSPVAPLTLMVTLDDIRKAMGF